MNTSSIPKSGRPDVRKSGAANLLVRACALVAMLALSGCDRAGASRTVLDWEVYLDVRSVQALDRWMAGERIETHDLRSGTIHRSIPAIRWLKGDVQRNEGPVPTTLLAGAVTEAPAPLATPDDLPVEEFPHPVTLVMRDRASGAELARRVLTPGYNTFKTFVDATATGEAGLLYRGNLLVMTPIDWNRGRHQSLTVSILAPGTGGTAAPPAPAWMR